MYGCFLNDGHHWQNAVGKMSGCHRGQLAVGPVNHCGSFLQQEINRTSFSALEGAFFMRALLFPWNATFLLQLYSQGFDCERHVFLFFFDTLNKNKALENETRPHQRLSQRFPKTDRLLLS